MFCTNCGRELSDGLNFCIYCGVRLANGNTGTAATQNVFDEEPAPASMPEASLQAAVNMEQPVQNGAQAAVVENNITEDAPAQGLLVLQDMKDSSKIYGCDLSRPAVLGRDASGCDVVIEGDKSVSRKHCRFFCRGNSCFVEDMNSFNHTYLNGTLVEAPQEIHVGDCLKFGMVELTVAECDMGS